MNQNWKEELKQLKLSYIKEKHPDYYKMSGEERMKIKSYSDQSTNSLTAAVYDWLKYSGHYVNRINSQGQARIKTSFVGGRPVNELKWTTGSTNKGTADIITLIDGKSVSIEIKCKATGDKVRKEQLEEKARIESAGGYYIIVQDMQRFVNWYKQFVSAEKFIS